MRQCIAPLNGTYKDCICIIYKYLCVKGKNMDFTADEYVIQRPTNFKFNVMFQVFDGKGTPAFVAKKHILGTRTDLLDPNGNLLGYFQQKFALKPTYEMHDASGSVIGKAVKTSHIVSLNSKYALEDPSGKPVALAVGDAFSYNYSVKDSKGEKDLATISKVSPFNAASSGNMSFFGELAAAMMNAYKITLIDKEFDKLQLIEFAMLIDLIIAQNSGTGINMGGGIGSTGEMGGGFGGTSIRI